MAPHKLVGYRYCGDTAAVDQWATSPYLLLSRGNTGSGRSLAVTNTGEIVEDTSGNQERRCAVEFREADARRIQESQSKPH